MSVRILQGDALAMLRTLPDKSVQCVVTSPPYFQLRDYGVDGQIGLERTPAAFLDALYAVFDEVKRVMRDDAVLFVNLGDSYAGSGKGPLKPGGYARIETDVRTVRAMAEGQDDDARIAEIRARHVAGGDPGDPHCEWCSGPDYPIWPCDVADLLAVIDAQRAIMDAQASVSEQHRKRVQEVAERSDALTAEASDVARENEALIEEVKAAGEQIAVLTAERDALLSELTSYRLDFNVSESHPRLRLREPEYFEANGHRYEKTATCRCCDERYAWGWVGDDGICLHCVDGRADIRAERDALTAERDADRAHLEGLQISYRNASDKAAQLGRALETATRSVDYWREAWEQKHIELEQAESERDALAARLAAAEAVEKVLRDGLRDLRGYSVSNWFLVDSTLAFAEKAALAGSREQPQGEEA